ncbi:unnamed protein product [Didymodactylos carnosus]|uniref:Peptidase A2 domain-containing protein n=1 Tax=Didymodactylos carnosus TaxID=1234261 RepID=A0A815AU74_9BILA|nr:unnamed protein product [Didymodactylos carnosus]CAF1260243.1 unnamed protein product [Didymodactylos carnosus]CAF4026334.1 unnamed protein product [Didymodactylos carnosus]CAF4037005.1 unnamed protein product [Didymodactylos carnosus]
MKALVDTAVSHTIIQQSALNKIRHKHVYPVQQHYHLADDASSLSIIGYVDLEIRIQHVRTYVTAAIAKSLSCPLIVGQDWITYYRVDYKSSTNRLAVNNNIVSVPVERVDEIQYITKLTIYNPNMYSWRLSANTNVGTITSLLSSDTLSNFINGDTTTSLTCDNNCSCEQHVNQYAYSDSDCLCSYGAYDNCYYQRYISSLNEQQQSHTTKCINMITDKNVNNSTTHVPTVIQDAIRHKHKKIFDTSSPTIAETTIPHTIRTADNPPVNLRSYRGSEQQQHALRNILKNMSASNQIRPHVRGHSFPIPTTELTLKQLSGHLYFTKLDLKS